MKNAKVSYWVSCPMPYLHGEGAHSCNTFCTLCANTGKVQAALAARYVVNDWPRWARMSRN